MIRGHGTDCMPTANVRYGRPKGSGLDDSQQLESVAALLAANPKLKPTTAIRLLGVQDPSTIRRLREKFRVEQARLLADARRTVSVGGMLDPCVGSNENTPAPTPLRSVAQRSPPSSEVAVRPDPSPAALLSDYCEWGLTALSAAIATQAAFTQYWLGLPAVAAATRGQLAFNAVAVAAYTKSKTRPLFLR
jgi:hypothetical protein